MVLAEQPRPAPRTRCELIEVECEPLPRGRRHGRRRRSRERRVLHAGVGRQRRRLLPGRLRRRGAALRQRRRAGARAVRDPALRRHADRDARRGRPVGRARRHAHHVERHPGGPLRPAGAGRRPRAAAPQDPGDRARRGRRLRHQGQRLRRRTSWSRRPRIALAPPGEVDRGPARAHDERGPRARTRCTTSSIAARRDGTMLAVRDHIWLDLGAYNSWGIVLPYNTVAHLLGPHRVRESARRVPGRGHAQDAERAVPRRGPAGDGVRHGPHRRLPGARARAWIRPSSDAATISPRPTCRTSSACRIATATRSSTTAATSGPALEAALDAAGYDGVPRRAGGAARARASTAASGSPATSRAPPSGRSRAPRVAARPAGRAVVATGAVQPGQGHETSFAQIAADALGIPLDWVTVVGGDTAAIPFGVGTFASRSAVNAGSSIHDAAGRGAGQGRRRRRPRCSRPPPPTSRSRDGTRLGARGARLGDAARPRVIQAAHPDLRQARRGPARLRGHRLPSPADRDLHERGARRAGGGRRETGAVRCCATWSPTTAARSSTR